MALNLLEYYFSSRLKNDLKKLETDYMLFEQERRNNVLYKQDLAGGSPVRDLFKSEQEAASGAEQDLERIPVLERLRSEKGIERNSFRNMLLDEMDVGRSTVVQDLLFKEQEWKCLS